MSAHRVPPIQVTLNYWELKAGQLGPKLNDLLRQGLTHITAFLPWQAVESDITHALLKFLQAAAERRMSVQLIATPELGVHYAYSGVPKDVVTRKENAASHANGQPVLALLPPQAFALPSLLAPELNKRFNSFLSRLDLLFVDLLRNHPRVLDRVQVTLTGSFWKYYRTHTGAAGEYSPASAVQFRQKLEAFLSSREFMDPTPSAANRWKTRGMEDVNRRWFYQSSEDAFRSRCLQQILRKSQTVHVEEIELYTPECDPELQYASFLQMLTGGDADFAQYSRLVEESCTRAGSGVRGMAPTFVHWTSMGGYRTLSDPERQFLFLKTLLMAGAQKGGILIDEAEWFAFSPAFRARAEAISRMMSAQELEMRNQALYLTPHLWSKSGPLWPELLEKLGPGARMVSSIENVLREPDSPLLVVDPSQIFTRELLIKLLAWARGGRVVALPRTALYTEAAKRELEAALNQGGRLELDLGVAYTLQPLGDGKLIVYERPQEDEASAAARSCWQGFAQALLSVAEVESYCRLSDARLQAIALHEPRGGLALFVLNGSRRAVSADIHFAQNVEIQDLALRMSAEAHSDSHAPSAAPPAQRFALEVPAFGILPLRVTGLALKDQREKTWAIELAEETMASLEFASHELAGFEESIWSE